MKRVYHRYEKWEDFQHGMWRVVTKEEEQAFLKAAVEFTGDADLYGSYMNRVVKEWPISCEQNLTNEGMNRLAWVGHAACAMAINCPEYITRRAWGLLSEAQRLAANNRASEAIVVWTSRYRDERQLTLWDTRIGG